MFGNRKVDVITVYECIMNYDMDRFDRSYDDIIIFIQRHSFIVPSNEYLMTESLTDIVTKIPFIIGTIKDQTEAICMVAVQQSGLALFYVKQPTEVICLVAVQQNGMALEFVKEQT